MAFDFPSSPTFGQKFPASPIAGIPTYTWDGEKWTTSGASIGQYVAKTGDTMTGDLTISKATPIVTVDSVGLTQSRVNGSRGGLRRFALVLVNNDAEGSGNTGSSFSIARYDNSGAFIDNPLAIDRATGSVSVTTAPTFDQSVATKQYVDAGDAVALAPMGMQINGGFEVSQEKTIGTITSVSGQYICDGWKLGFAGTMAPSALVSSTFFSGGAYFSNFMYMAPGTVEAALAAGDYLALVQGIEGTRTARLGWGTPSAQPVTICFWSYHTQPGVYSVAVRNGATTRSYVATYNHVTANIPQYNTITIPGDTAGTWTVDNLIGVQISFCGGAGTTFTASSANTWLAGNLLAAPGQTNIATATTNTVRFAGVNVVPGASGPPAARSALAMRPFDQELQLCQRYYGKSYNYATAPGAASVGSGSNSGIADASSLIVTNIKFKTMMRATPAMTFYGFSGNAGVWSVSGSNANTPAVSAGAPSESGVSYVACTGLTAGVMHFGHYVADARL